MIRKSDWPLIGLKGVVGGTGGPGRFGVPAAASPPLREVTKLYPTGAAHPRRSLRLGFGCSVKAVAAI